MFYCMGVTIIHCILQQLGDQFKRLKTFILHKIKKNTNRERRNLIFYSLVHFVLQIRKNTQLDVAYRESDRLRVKACETNGVSQPLTGNI